jgi:hypothetical protein
MPAPIKAIDFVGDLREFQHGYVYQPKLTARLDNLKGTTLTDDLVNEIVLWKVNRFVDLDEGTLRGIDGLASLNPGEHRQSESVLFSLLEVHGVDLPWHRHFCAFGTQECSRS